MPSNKRAALTRGMLRAIRPLARLCFKHADGLRPTHFEYHCHIHLSFRLKSRAPPPEVRDLPSEDWLYTSAPSSAAPLLTDQQTLTRARFRLWAMLELQSDKVIWRESEDVDSNNRWRCPFRDRVSRPASGGADRCQRAAVTSRHDRSLGPSGAGHLEIGSHGHPIAPLAIWPQTQLQRPSWP